MEKTITERLEKFIEYKKLSMAQFGKPFRASRQEIHNWCSGTKMNVYRISEMIEAYPELNLNWFVTGRGNMLSGGKEMVQPVCTEESCVLEKKMLINKINELLSEIIKLQNKLLERDTN